jgi:hypothetical protein
MSDVLHFSGDVGTVLPAFGSSLMVLPTNSEGVSGVSSKLCCGAVMLLSQAPEIVATQTSTSVRRRRIKEA